MAKQLKVLLVHSLIRARRESFTWDSESKLEMKSCRKKVPFLSKALFFSLRNGFVWKTCDENVASSLVIKAAKGKKITIFFKSRQKALKRETMCGMLGQIQKQRKKFFLLFFAIARRARRRKLPKRWEANSYRKREKKKMKNRKINQWWSFPSMVEREVLENKIISIWLSSDNVVSLLRSQADVSVGP